MGLDDIHVELFLCENSHMLIGLEIMGIHSRHLVEYLTKIVLYLFFD